MRLIDADEWVRILKERQCKSETEEKIIEVFIEIVDTMPTAFDVAAVVEQLELQSKMYSLNKRDCEIAIRLDKALRIVKGGGIDGRYYSNA